MADEQTPTIKIVTFRIDRVNLSKIDITKAPRGVSLIRWWQAQQIAEKQAPVIDMPDLRDDV